MLSIHAFDATQTPAKIGNGLQVTREGRGDTAQMPDLEGVEADGESGFWQASETCRDRLIPLAIYRVDAKGEIPQETALSPDTLANKIRFGFDGITIVGDWLCRASGTMIPERK